jgi:hypothetical protein
MAVAILGTPTRRSSIAAQPPAAGIRLVVEKLTPGRRARIGAADAAQRQDRV